MSIYKHFSIKEFLPKNHSATIRVLATKNSLLFRIFKIFFSKIIIYFDVYYLQFFGVHNLRGENLKKNERTIERKKFFLLFQKLFTRNHPY